MERHELTELHFITPIVNVSGILRHGILSHKKAKETRHASIAMDEIQERRKRVTIPGGRPLHDYANLYLCARNPMLYKRLGQRDQLCVLRINTTVLDIEGAIVSDGNASSDYTRFSKAPEGLKIVEREYVFADVWVDQDPIEGFRKKRQKCAEILVPGKVTTEYILGAYVANAEAMGTLEQTGFDRPIEMNQHLFFLQ